MRTSRFRVRNWLVVVVILAIATAVELTFSFLTRGDQIAAEAAANLQVGMTENELCELLKPVRPSVPKMKTRDGAVVYLFYAVDEFVAVVMDKDGDGARVAKVEHMPDDGPTWDRFRRRWEHRFW